MERYRSAQVGITNAITNNNRNWKQAADQQLDFIDYISAEKLMDIIIGNIYLQWIYYALQICGYISGVTFLGSTLAKICKKKRISCPSITLKTFKTVKNVNNVERRVPKDVLEWSDEDTDEEDESIVDEENELKTRKRTSNMDSPPSYDIVNESQF